MTPEDYEEMQKAFKRGNITLIVILTAIVCGLIILKIYGKL